eukprot:1151970-Pelagomonas_calceolata.AAC.1
MRHTFDGESRPGITDITYWRSTIGPDSFFNSKSVNSQPESGNVVKDMMWKIQIHVLRQCRRRANGMSSSDRKCAPLMICQSLAVLYSGIRSCELIPVAKVRACQMRRKRYTKLNLNLVIKRHLFAKVGGVSGVHYKWGKGHWGCAFKITSLQWVLTFSQPAGFCQQVMSRHLPEQDEQVDFLIEGNIARYRLQEKEGLQSKTGC